MVLLFLLLGALRVYGEDLKNAADSLGFYLFESTLSEDELGLSMLETSWRPPSKTFVDSSLKTICHSIHHRAAVLRQKEAHQGEKLTDRYTFLEMKYPDPQFIGISVDSGGIPRNLISSFTRHVLSHLVPYKDHLIGVKSCSNASSTLFKGMSSLHPELFHSILPQIPLSLKKTDIMDVFSIIILSRGLQPLNGSLLNEIRSAITPKRLRLHVFGYKPTPEAEKSLKSLADSYHTLNSEDDLSQSIGSSFLYRRYASSSVKIIVPPLGKEVIFAHLVRDETVMGLRVPRSYLFSEVYGYNGDEASVYLFEKSGRLLYQASSEDLYRNTNFRTRVMKSMLRDKGGVIVSKNGTYSWKRVDTTPFIVLMVKYANSLLHIEDNSSPTTFDILKNNVTLEFHQKLETKLCKHFRSPANTDTGSLFLSGLAFKDPLNRPKPKDFMDYINDESSHNPGVRTGIKEEVRFLTQITPFWKSKAFDSGLNNYIVRRYIATLSGVLYVYPGVRFSNDDMDPKMQEWFLRASNFPGKSTLTSPRLDPGGAGYIVTLSRTLFHTRYRTPPAILAMDITLGYLYKVLINTLPICKESNQSKHRCFIFDHEGYVIVHPKLIRGKDLDKKYHLTHFEPQIINELLTFQDFVRKTVCTSRRDETVVHKRYEFNESYSSSVVSLRRNRCNSFQIAPIPKSNLFLGIVNGSNCNEGAPINFCPCNVEGDRCIICGSLELMECECPCTCSDPCLLYGNGSLPACEEEPQRFDPAPVDLDYLSDLPKCLTTECGSRTKEEDCLGVLGCSWCQEKLISSYDNSNWVSMRSDSFCGTLDECFDGKLGQLSPYQLIDSSSQKFSSMGTFDEFRSSPIGPVAGGIMGLFLFLSISVYCYRYYMNNSTSLSSNSDQGSRRLFDHSSLRTVDEEEDKSRPHYTSGNLSSIEIPPNAIISPYRMNPEYRRPPPGTESDHGYSTMTPFGDIDSDIAVISNPQPFRGLVAQAGSNCSSSRTSSPSVNNLTEHSIGDSCDPIDESVTVLGANQFIVAATIHMVDTQ